MHSVRLPQNTSMRLAFMACAALGILIHVGFLVPAIGVALALREDFASWKFDLLDQYYIHAPAAMVAMLWVAILPMPADDLLGILAIAAGKFSHQDFIYSDWAQLGISPWVGYEALLSKVVHAFGLDAAMRLAQGAALLASLGAAFFSVRREYGTGRAQVWLFLLLALLFAGDYVARAIGARVEVFYLAWMIAARCLPLRIWFVVGLLMAPLYWLAWVYLLPGALLSRAPLRQKLFLAVALPSIAILLWYALTDGHYFEMYRLTRTWLAAREFTVGENLPLMVGMFTPVPIIIAGAVLIALASGLASREDWPFLMAAIWFMLPDMARYLPAIEAVSVVWLARAVTRMPPERIPKPPQWLMGFLLIWLAIMYAHTFPKLNAERLPAFQIPSGARLIAPMNTGLMASLYRNSGLRVAPAFEPGSTTPSVQRAIAKLADGRFDCALMTKYPFDYLQESSLTELPDCLELVATHHAWRLWKIHPRSPRP